MIDEANFLLCWRATWAFDCSLSAFRLFWLWLSIKERCCTAVSGLWGAFSLIEPFLCLWFSSLVLVLYSFCFESTLRLRTLSILGRAWLCATLAPPSVAFTVSYYRLLRCYLPFLSCGRLSYILFIVSTSPWFWLLFLPRRSTES